MLYTVFILSLKKVIMPHSPDLMKITYFSLKLSPHLGIVLFCFYNDYVCLTQFKRWLKKRY